MPTTPTAPREVEGILLSHLKTWPGDGAVALTGATAVAAGGRVERWVACAGSCERPFPWASVTKLLVSLACLVAVEEGTLDLDEPAGPPGSTLAHLLAHASGLPFDGSVPLVPPGRRRIYSNTGAEIAAELLEERSGMAFADYLYAGALEPLGMSATALRGSPAHGAQGPLGDLVRLAGELLSPSLIGQPTWRRATTVAWPGLAGVVPGFGRQDPCDWGLGPEIRGNKSPHWTGLTNSPSTYGHFGQSGSFLWVDPAAGVAMVGLSSTPFGPWAKGAWPSLSDAVLAAITT